MGTQIAFIVAAALAGCVACYYLGRRTGREAGREEGHREARETAASELSTLTRAVASGDVTNAVASESTAALVSALEHWVPRGEERRTAMREATATVCRYLDSQVQEVLAKAGPESTVTELREIITNTLGNLSDVRFFLGEPKSGGEPHDLLAVIGQVAREFAQDQGVRVRMHRDPGTLRASIQPDDLMDALYLLFHNAARFGKAPVIDVSVETEGRRVRIKVSDRGKGFSKTAKQRAFDPFFTSVPDGLGLGLPRARRLVEAMGGRIEVGNAPSGGGEVTISFAKV